MIKKMLVLFCIYNLYTTWYTKSCIAEEKKDLIVFDNADKIFKVFGVVSEGMANRFIAKIATYRESELYIYINSPGGSIDGMVKILSTMDMYKDKIKFIGIAETAASAAFYIFQNCQTRYILTNGLLMTHLASIGIQGNLYQVKDYVDMIYNQIVIIEKKVAKQLGMSYQEYVIKISRDWFLDAVVALENKAADKMIFVKCTKELVEQILDDKITEMSFFGFYDLAIKRSACPIISTYDEVKK